MVASGSPTMIAGFLSSCIGGFRPQRPRLDQRHSKSDGGMGYTSNYRGIPWDEAPHYLIRDRDQIYGSVVTRRVRAMGIRGQTYRTSLALAEWLCRTADRIDPA
jgi:hypothetical protein